MLERKQRPGNSRNVVLGGWKGIIQGCQEGGVAGLFSLNYISERMALTHKERRGEIKLYGEQHGGEKKKKKSETRIVKTEEERR